MKDEKMKAGSKKGEYMTSLFGDHLVLKTHPRIVFRGLIDTLEAEVIEAQVLASDSGEGEYCLWLGEILDYLRALMAAEVKETPLSPPLLFGMDAEEIHRCSHQVCGLEGKSTLPVFTQGPLASRLNTLRAKVREVELFAVRVFGPGKYTQEKGTQKAGDTKESHQVPGTGKEEREDIILALNRLSSAIWWLFCNYVANNPDILAKARR